MQIKHDIREVITNKIIEALENNLKPWNSQVICEQPQNMITKQYYSGINRVYLSLIAYINGYKLNKWLSYNQAKSLGGNVKKGEKGTHIIFYKTYDNKEIEKEEIKEKNFPVMKHYNIFNIEQCENISVKEDILETFIDDNIDNFINKLNVNIEYKNSDKAFYSPIFDYITMPLYFKNKNAQYATMLHEILHWTGHEARLNRLKKFEKYGSESYAFEELIAEIGSAFLCSHFRIKEELENHASYIKAWLCVLKKDKKAIFEAAARAQEAFNFVLSKANENKMIA